MTYVTYYALRDLTGVTAEGQIAMLEIGITEHVKSRAAIKDTHRSKGGARETLYHRADVTHQITFQPVNGFAKKQLNEFLASTESGETFSLYLFGNESSPLSLVRDDESHTETAFMRTGSIDQDYVQVSITAMET